MTKRTLMELVEAANCRVGAYAGKEGGCKFWRPFKVMRIKRELVGYDMISSDYTFEIRHFQDGDMQVIVRFNDWMDDKYSKKWVSPNILGCTSLVEVSSILRKGFPFSENENGDISYCMPVDNDGWDRLEVELLNLGLRE